MRWFRASLKHLFCASTFVVKIAHFARPEIVIAIRMKHYFKRQWEETTGDELTDTWGTSTYFVETDEQFNVIRQIQVFEKRILPPVNLDELNTAKDLFHQ